MTTEMEAFASLREAFPEMTLIEVIKEKLMTDVIDATAANADQDWSDVETSASFPEVPSNPHNHRFTVSFDPSKPPFVVVRASTGPELKAAFDELVESGAYAVMAAAQAALKSAGSAPLPAAAGAPQFQAMAQQQFNQQPAQQFPGVTGQAPAAWQNAGAPAQGAGAKPMSPEYVQSGWYKLNVPYKQKPVFDGLTAQYGFRKGRPSEGGQFSFSSADKAWYCSAEIAGAFQQFQPVPAGA